MDGLDGRGAGDRGRAMAQPRAAPGRPYIAAFSMPSIGFADMLTRTGKNVANVKT